MRLATWNVNSVRTRIPRIIDTLDRHSIDVLAMQETKCTDDQFPRDVFADAGYDVAVCGTHHWNGVAIASRVGLTSIHTLPHQPGFNKDLTAEHTIEPRSIAATCGGITIMSLYVPNGRAISDIHFTYKLRFLDAVRTYASHAIDNDPELLLALVGDWNIAPHDSDVWDPTHFIGRTHVTPRERNALTALEDEGFTDVTHSSGYTYWDYTQGRFGRNHGMRIDMQWASPALTETAGAVTVDKDERAHKGSSDHAPLIVDYDI